MAVLVEVRDLVKRFGDGRGGWLPVLDGVSVRVDGLVCVLGPSGCGKSTLLNVVAGLEPLDAGQIHFYRDGHRVEREEVRIGYVFQDPRLLNWRTVQENVEFGLQSLQLPPTARRARARAYLQLVGLEDFAGQFPLFLSGGMRQRVGLARALALEPDVVLMDEPFSKLDEITARELRQELLGIQGRLGQRILFVTHNPGEAALLGDRIYVLSDRPARVVAEVSNPIPKPRQAEAPEVAALARDIVGYLRTGQGAVTRRTFLVSGLALVAGAVAGRLGSLAWPPTAWAQPRVEVSVAAVGATGLLMRLVKDLGLDRKHGVELNVVPLAVADAERAVVQGRVPVGIFNPISAVRALAEGHPLKLFAPFLLNHNYLLVRAESPYRRLEDLRGKPVGSLSKISGTYNTLAAILYAKGLGDPERYFQVRFGEAVPLIALMERGDLEAVALFEAHVSRLLATGRYRVLLEFNEEFRRMTAADNLFIALAAKPAWLEANGTAARQIRAALAEAVEAFRQNPVGILERYGREIFGLDTAAEIQLAARRLRGVYTGRWDRAFLDRQIRQLRLVQSRGDFLPSHVSPEEVFWP
jgi:ABC-type nitrate/sulfonate/bicarbonate transport system ATPase subunit/ABC-type nitrate/sulfonate/bicarbonate transport system substrate-binding protein